MTFYDWAHRHLAGNDPAPEPASPPPFKTDDRVVVSPHAMDAMFVGGRHGIVVGVEFTTDENDPYGPWIIRVRLDGQRDVLKFHAAELTREGEHEEPTEAVTVFVKQPEDTEPPAPHEDDFEPYAGADLDAPVPYKPTRAAELESLKPWLQRARELRHETVFTDTPVYDDVTASAMAADGLAAEVSAFLAEVAGGAA